MDKKSLLQQLGNQSNRCNCPIEWAELDGGGGGGGGIESARLLGIAEQRKRPALQKFETQVVLADGASAGRSWRGICRTPQQSNAILRVQQTMGQQWQPRCGGSCFRHNNNNNNNESDGDRVTMQDFALLSIASSGWLFAAAAAAPALGCQASCDELARDSNLISGNHFRLRVGHQAEPSNKGFKMRSSSSRPSDDDKHLGPFRPVALVHPSHADDGASREEEGAKRGDNTMNNNSNNNKSKWGPFI